MAAVAISLALLIPFLKLRHPLALSQPASYHNFADQRAVLGIPNFLNVASNLPFAVIGIWGLVFIVPGTGERNRAFLDQRERWPYFVLFAGLFLTAFGSAYYHLSPSNATLLWDRLPMSIMFAGFVAAVVAESVNAAAGLMLLPFLLLLSVGSVLQWYSSELHGHGDLRWYAAVQVYSVLTLLIAPLLPAQYSRRWDFWVIFVFYALAKVLETFDRHIYSIGHVVSGHTLKHMVAATAGYWILRMLQLRQPLHQEFIAR